MSPRERPAPTTPQRDRVPLPAAAWALGGVIGFTALLALVTLGVGRLVPSVMADHTELAVGAFLLTHTAGALGWLVLVARRFRLTAQSLGLVHPSWRLLHLLWQFPAGLVFFLIVQGVMDLGFRADLPRSTESATAELLQAGPLLLVLTVLTAGVAVPVWEELTFRGFLYGAVRDRWNVAAAWTTSAALFALAHLVPIMLPYYVATGIWLGFLRWFHGSLWGPMLFHMSLNLLVSGVALALI